MLPLAAFLFAAGMANGQTIEVGGAATIGDSTLTTTLGVAKLPATGANWTASGGNGNTTSSLVSPSTVVANTGAVTLTFTHRYNFEDTFDGGEVFVSIDGGSFVLVPTGDFSSNGYNSTASVLPDSVAFSGQSAGWGTPALITSVASLGNLTAGQTVVVEFRGGWDSNTFPASPNWEIGTVNISDTGATLLDVDFTPDGASGFTASTTGTGSSPWLYNPTQTHRFELDATADTADRYKPDIAGSVIDLNGAKIQVALLNGTLASGDVFSLFDLSGGTTLTGSLNSISLPTGVWNTSSLATAGTITLTTALVPADGTWSASGGGSWIDTANWNASTIAYGTDKTASFTSNITAASTVTLGTDITIGNITFTDSTSSHDLTISGANTLTLDVTSGTPQINVTQTGNRQLTISSVITGSDGLEKIGPGILNLTGASTYTGTTTVSDGLLNFASANLDGIGGGPGSRDISVAANKLVQRTHNNLDAAFMKRLVETSNEFAVCVTASGASDVGTGKTVDFSSSTNGANLPNAFFASFATNGGQCRYNGTIIPASDNYRLGFPGTNGALSMIQPLVDIGTPRGLIVGGASPVLVADNTFTGDTVLRSGRLFLGRQLALQNSALNVGNGAGDGITGQICFLSSNTGGATQGELTNAPTLGGLIGARNLASIYNSANQNNTTRLAIASVLGLTLDVDTGKTHTYSGNARLSTGMYLTKTGPGTQVLSGANDYTGATSVNQGTLALVGGSHASAITVASGASLGFTLGSPTTSTKSVALTAGHTIKITGTVDNSSDYQLMTATLGFTGTPALDSPITDYALQLQNSDTELWLVYTGGGSPYGTWSGGAAADIDTNNDGVDNGVAWALGALDPNENAIGLLPTLDNTTDPIYVLFTFQRSDAAQADTNTAITVQYGTDLASWTTAVDDNNNVEIEVTDGSPKDTVVVKLKRSTLGAGGKLFARLNVVVTP